MRINKEAKTRFKQSIYKNRFFKNISTMNKHMYVYSIHYTQQDSDVQIKIDHVCCYQKKYCLL